SRCQGDEGRWHMSRHWRDLLREAQQHIDQHYSREAFLSAFRALEACFLQQVACPLGQQSQDSFSKCCLDLHRGNRLPKGDYDLALHLNKARNVMSHTFGFEPSLSEAIKTLNHVRRLCQRFSVRVCDVMVQPVRTAKPDDPFGLYLRAMREEGISQFPVVD